MKPIHRIMVIFFIAIQPFKLTGMGSPELGSAVKTLFYMKACGAGLLSSTCLLVEKAAPRYAVVCQAFNAGGNIQDGLALAAASAFLVKKLPEKHTKNLEYALALLRIKNYLKPAPIIKQSFLPSLHLESMLGIAGQTDPYFGVKNLALFWGGSYASRRLIKNFYPPNKIQQHAVACYKQKEQVFNSLIK